jgi:hypothetical protein
MSELPLDALTAAVGPGLGEGVVRGSATVRPIPVPGVPGSVVWLVRDDSLDHPLQAYVGRWPNGQVRVLSDDPDAWADLVAAVGAHLDTAATALGYIRAFLECTRGPAVPVLEITGADELPWRPGSPDEERRRADFLAGPPVREPLAVARDGGFRVELTLIVGPRVQRNLFDVTTAGLIDATFVVLARDLPLSIVR